MWIKIPANQQPYNFALRSRNITGLAEEFNDIGCFISTTIFYDGRAYVTSLKIDEIMKLISEKIVVAATCKQSFNPNNLIILAQDGPDANNC